MTNKNKINLIIAFLGLLFLSRFLGNTAINTEIVLGDMYIFQNENPQQKTNFFQFGDQYYLLVSKEFEDLKKASVVELNKK